MNIAISVALMQTLYFDDKYVGRVVGGTLSFVLIGLVIYLRIMIKGAHFLIKTVEIRFKNLFTANPTFLSKYSFSTIR